MSFQKLLREAAKHFTVNGYTSQSDINHWRVRLLTAAEQHLNPEGARETIRRTLGKAFFKAIGEGRVAKRHGSVHKFTIDQLDSKLKDELERRMFAAQELVEGDKRATLERIHNRFLGLATAGPNPGEAQAAASAIGKAARDSRAQERMTAIDQTSKLVGALDEIIAADGGSIAGMWDATKDIIRKHRPEHLSRHGKVYIRRGTWADTGGMVRHPEGYIDEFDMPKTLINCRCEYVYLYDLTDLPPEFLTAKGHAAA